MTTSESIIEFLKDKEFTEDKVIKNSLSGVASEEAVRVALIRLEKSGHIEKKCEGRTKLFKYVADFQAHRARELDATKFVRDYIFKILTGHALTMDEVFTKVIVKFPDTTKGNVKTILTRESSKGELKKIESIPYQFTRED